MFTPRNLLRLVLIALVALTLSWVLQGCAGMEEFRGPKVAALEPVFVTVDSQDIEKVCGSHPGMVTHACTRRDWIRNVAVIYTAKNPPEWLVRHERRHANGENH